MTSPRVYRRLQLQPHHYPGTLITFCGVDGSGKSSLIAALEAACRRAGLRYLHTATPTRRFREDAAFRAMVGDPCNTSTLSGSSYNSVRRVNVLGVLLSIMGDLIQHTTDTIIPALERGAVVLCDRYIYTSHAEIGARTDLRETEPVLAAIAERVLRPDLAFGLCVSSETSRRRVESRNDVNDRPPPPVFLERQVQAYRDVIASNRLIALDSERPLVETVARALSCFEALPKMAEMLASAT